MAIWSRRNFITVSSLATIAAAVPVAAAKATTKAVSGWITSLTVDGRTWKYQAYDESDADFRARVGEAVPKMTFRRERRR